MIVVHSLGPIYWGVEDITPYLDYEEHQPDRSWFTGAWLVEDSPPYRRSIPRFGFRMRVPGLERAVHFGLCRKGKSPHRGLDDATPDTIGQWRGPQAQTPQADRDGPHDDHADARTGTGDRDIPG